jgi:hypothetical protein
VSPVSVRSTKPSSEDAPGRQTGLRTSPHADSAAPRMLLREALTTMAR